MPTKQVIRDPADGLVVDEVGAWASEKHERLRKYIDASRGARAKYLPPNNPGGASYIELFSGPGRSQIRGTTKIIDGSPLVAYNAAHASGAKFSEIHLADLEGANTAAAAKRIAKLGGAPIGYTGSAVSVVDKVIYALNPHGLHLAFLDPYNLEQLPFSIIEKLIKIQRMDMIIHVSLQDLQRNLDDYSRVGDPTLDNFAPGWRDVINTRQSIAPLRAAFIEFWLAKIRALGTHPATGIPLIVGEKNQRLYWLVFLSSHPLGQKLWNEVQNLAGQGSFDL
jgi:three-Cys-motif partner protein